ncbi:MAG: 2Fe-2S iron-sulfur cluster-binding protein [Fimbriimonadaceae bacterium]
MTFENQPLTPLPGETVLDTLLRHKIPIGFSCLKGECMSCIIRCIEGNPPPNSQEGLTRRMARTGHFKACCCPADQIQIVCRVSQI